MKRTHYKNSGNHTKKYLKWLHELTVALYDKEVIIPTKNSDLIECFYLQGFSIDKSVAQYLLHLKSRPELLKH